MHHKMGGMGCPTCGCGMGGGHGFGMKAMFMMMPWKVMMHAEELGISEEQVQKLRTRHIEAKKQMIRLGSQVKIAMIDVKDAVMREDMDLGAATAAIQEVAKLKAEKFTAMVQAIHDMREILTPEQRKKVKEMVMHWFKKSHGMGMEGEEEGEPEEEAEEE